MTLATVSSTVEPLIATPLIVLAIPPVLTAKAEVAAVVEESASSYVRIDFGAVGAGGSRGEGG